MATITITLPVHLEPLLSKRAASAGVGVSDYALKVLEREALAPLTFDEILAPFRQEVKDSAISDDDLNALFTKARQDYHRDQEKKS